MEELPGMKKLSKNPSDVREAAIKTMIKILTNILKNPTELKYRQLNRTFKSLQVPGFLELLVGAGFEESGEKMVLPEGKDVTWMVEKIRVTLRGRLVGLSSCCTLPSAAENRVDDNSIEMEEICIEDELGANVISRISTRIGCSKLKIIIGGKLLQEKKTLKEQGFLCNSYREGRPLLAVFSASGGKKELSNSGGGYPSKDVAEEVYQERVKAFDVREAIEALVNDNPKEYELSDPKSKNPLQMSLDAKKALCTAVALHEKGREILAQTRRIRSEDRNLFDSTVAEALAFLAEADQYFERCKEGIQSGNRIFGVEQLSNFEQLQFDICWAYVLLNSTHCLSDAFTRLARAEKMVDRHVGKDFMELQELLAHNVDSKESNIKLIAPEAIPSVRLWLLRGIALQSLGDNKTRDAKAKADLEKARVFMQALRVPEGMISHLCEFMRDQKYPISRRKAIATLRRHGGRVDLAASKLLNELMANRNNPKYQAEQDQLGKTADGSLIVLEHLEELTAMGIEKQLAVKALKVVNNDVQRALKLVTQLETKRTAQKELEAALASGVPPRLLQAIEAADRQKISVTMAKNRLDELMEESLAKLLSMGFEKAAAERALHAANGDVEEAQQLCSAAPSSVERATEVESGTDKTPMKQRKVGEQSPPGRGAVAAARSSSEVQALLLNDEVDDLKDLEKPGETRLASYPQCAHCLDQRMTWNCKAHEACCRTCEGSHGRQHGADCKRKHNELCGARAMGQAHLDAYVQMKLRMAEYKKLIVAALGGAITKRDADDELAGAELDQEEALLRQVYFDKF